jgi:oxygen-independent coproporphyrinogen-3 oxidase
MDWPRLQAAGFRRDPGTYNLVVHFLPPELARDHAAPEAVRARLSEQPGPLGLYLHVAPCTGRCTFCHYAIEVNPSDAALDAYLAALEREMTTRWSTLDPRVSPVRSVLVGGGTPTYLSAAQLDRLLGHLRRTVALPEGIEFTVESSPETLTADKLAVLRDHGVNRLNVGIQAFDDALLRTLGRRHDAHRASNSLALAHASGMPHINLDLIYALPGQTLDGWLDSLRRAVDLGVHSITTYHLRKRPDTVISRRPSPAEDDAALMHVAAMVELQAAGFRHSLADYFVRADLPTAQVQARDKWRDMQPVDGCGLEACSRRPDVVAFDVADFAAYPQAVAEQNGWALAHGRFLLAEEQMAQRAMFQLKVLDDDGGIHRATFASEFGEPLEGVFGDVLAELATLGVTRDDGVRVRLTEAGALLADEVCNRFYSAELRRRIEARVKVHPQGAPVPHPRGAGRLTVDSADVVVVGAGVAGLAAAVALQRDLGAGVLVLEAGEPGSGATSAAVGGFRYQFKDAAMTELSLRSLAAYEALVRDGAELGLERDGYLFLATTEADAADLALQARTSEAAGEPVEWLEGQQLRALVPGLHTDDVLAGVYGPRDGRLDPHGLVRAWRRRLGQARLQTGTVVRRLAVDRGRVVGVYTDAGLVAAGTVVLAAGAATRALALEAGVALPLTIARRRVHLATGTHLPTRGPLVMTATPPLYFRPEATGLVVSARELSDDGELTGIDWLATARDRAVHRLPALAAARFREAWTGEQVATPDGLHLVGPCPGLDGLLLATGLAGYGIMHAAAVGELVRGWWAGEADPLADAFDPRRLTLG